MTAEEFREWRRTLGMSVNALSRWLRVDTSTLRRWARGQARIPPIVDTVRDLHNDLEALRRQYRHLEFLQNLVDKAASRAVKKQAGA